MNLLYPLCVFALAIQRTFELLKSRRNQKALSRLGYVFDEPRGALITMVAVHSLWFVALLAEPLILHPHPLLVVQIAALFILLLAQSLRFWAISSLGQHWNISVMSPRATSETKPFIAEGPYRYIRHPNYLAVILEFFSLPLIGGAYITCFVFSVLNAVVLARRIQTEEKHLFTRAGYRDLMGHKGRLVPNFFH